MDAIILCAGEGTRLLPMSLHRAKPLIPVLCEPILGHIIGKLEKHGIYRAGTNIWHRQEDFLDYCAEISTSPVRLSLVPEKELLGTGGGIANVAAHLEPAGPVLVHNGDIFTDADLSAAIRKHRSSGAMLTLLVREGDPEIRIAGDTVVDIAGRFGSKGERAYKFIGISVWETEALKYLPRAGEPGGAVDSIAALISSEPGSVTIHDIGGALWSDIGTPGEYIELHRKLLGKETHLAEGVEIPPGVRIDGFLCACEGASIGAGSRLEDVIIWRGGDIAPGSRLAKAVVGPFGILRI